MNMLHNLRVRKDGIWVILLLVIGGLLTACNQNAVNDLSPVYSPVYITNYDRSINFSQYKTFSLPDSVIIQSNDDYAAVRNSLSDQFVTNVTSALSAKGFQRVNRGQTADLGVAIIRVNNQYTGIASNPYSYYSSYWGYGGLGGYGGYSPYYQSYYTYQVSDQYWEIQIVDLKNAPTAGTGTNQQLNVVYDATIRGTDVADTQAVTTAVTTIFNQSPYLQTTR